MNSLDRIRDYIASQISVPLANDDDFFERGLVDSLFALQLVSFIEEEFRFTIEPDDLDIVNFCSIDALNSFVLAKSATPV